MSLKKLFFKELQGIGAEPSLSPSNVSNDGGTNRRYTQM